MAMDRPRKGWAPGPLPPLAPGEVRLLSGGNPQIAKGDGPGPVAAYIAAMPGWKSGVGARIDALVSELCPDARRAVRWNAPFWGLPDRGWMLSLSCLTRAVKITFLRGTSLDPMPPVGSKVAGVRYLHMAEADTLDEVQVRDWLRQAAAIDGERLF